MKESSATRWESEDRVREDLQQHPQLYLRLVENAFTVAESLRDNYFKNTASFVTTLRKAMSRDHEKNPSTPILQTFSVQDVEWTDVQNEVVTFIDGGVGQVQVASRVPILLRVGSYRVRTGERQMKKREQFGYYPIILGDLEGGSKDRKDFIDIVRITAELLGGLASLDRTPDLRVLMFHGPLVYLMSGYVGHTPFTETDIDLFLYQYGPSPAAGRALKEEYLREARLDIYPRLTTNSEEWYERRVFEPLSWIAFLYRRLIATARQRSPVPLICGVVERGGMRDFSESILLERIYRRLREKDTIDYFNDMFGRTDLVTPKNLLDKLGYTDTLLLAMLLEPGEVSEPWVIASKYEELRRARVSLPGEVRQDSVDFSQLRPGPFGFPHVCGSYVQVSKTTEPVRIEVFADLGEDQIERAARRTYLYSRLLPGYGFPVGLDVVDKHAKVPAWLTDAYSKLIRHHLGVSLQRGEISDAEMRRILVQAIYMTHRDWLFRPDA